MTSIRTTLFTEEFGPEMTELRNFDLSRSLLSQSCISAKDNDILGKHEWNDNVKGHRTQDTGPDKSRTGHMTDGSKRGIGRGLIYTDPSCFSRSTIKTNDIEKNNKDQ